MERLKRPESRRMAEPLASVEAFEGFEGFEGQFRATRKKDLACQSPEPTVCATPPTVPHRAQSPQSSKCEVLEQPLTKAKVRHLRWSQAPPLPSPEQGSADIVVGSTTTKFLWPSGSLHYYCHYCFVGQLFGGKRYVGKEGDRTKYEYAQEAVFAQKSQAVPVARHRLVANRVVLREVYVASQLHWRMPWLQKYVISRHR